MTWLYLLLAYATLYAAYRFGVLIGMEAGAELTHERYARLQRRLSTFEDLRKRVVQQRMELHRMNRNVRYLWALILPRVGR